MTVRVVSESYTHLFIYFNSDLSCSWLLLDADSAISQQIAAEKHQQHTAVLIMLHVECELISFVFGNELLFPSWLLYSRDICLCVLHMCICLCRHAGMHMSVCCYTLCAISCPEHQCVSVYGLKKVHLKHSINIPV